MFFPENVIFLNSARSALWQSKTDREREREWERERERERERESEKYMYDNIMGYSLSIQKGPKYIATFEDGGETFVSPHPSPFAI